MIGLRLKLPPSNVTFSSITCRKGLPCWPKVRGSPNVSLGCHWKWPRKNKSESGVWRRMLITTSVYYIIERTPGVENRGGPEECANEVVQIRNKALNLLSCRPQTRSQEKLDSARGTFSSTLYIRTSRVPCTETARRWSHSFGALNMASNHEILTYNISKYSRQIAQSITDAHNTSNGGEWEHRSGSGLRLLLERTLTDDGSPNQLVLRVIQDSSTAFKPTSRSNILVCQC